MTSTQPTATPARADGRPNVLFLLTDEHSYRFLADLPADVGEPAQTPTLSGLAAQGTRFEATYCAYPLCTPSRLCLLTGRQAPNCHAWTNKSVLYEEFPTIGDAFSAAGYATSLLGKMHLGGDRQFCGFSDRRFGDLTQGAGHQADPIRKDRRTKGRMRSRTADVGRTEIPESLHQENVVARESLSFLRELADRRPDQPWLLCASFSRPHFPLTAPRRHLRRYWPDRATPPKVRASDDDTSDHPMTVAMREFFNLNVIDAEEEAKARAAYFACVDYVDEVIGDFLAMLDHAGFLDNTIIVYTSDHGELAGEHGLWWKQAWHEASTRVPWIVQTPEQRSGAAPAHRIQTPVSLVDLLPTLTGLCGIPAPEGIDGIDLSAAARTGAEPERGPVISDRVVPTFGEGSEFRSVRFGRYKYVGFRAMPELLFDLADDPDERHNLAAVAELTDEQRLALERGRALVADSIDFAEVERMIAVDHERTDHQARTEVGTGNVYVLPDGRLVDADTTIYSPFVLAERAAEAFSDWPIDPPADPVLRREPAATGPAAGS